MVLFLKKLIKYFADTKTEFVNILTNIPQFLIMFETFSFHFHRIPQGLWITGKIFSGKSVHNCGNGHKYVQFFGQKLN